MIPFEAPLGCRKLKLLPSLTEKNLNQSLNVWMRYPLGAFMFAAAPLRVTALLRAAFPSNILPRVDQQADFLVALRSAINQIIGSYIHPSHYAGMAHRICTLVFGVQAFWNGGFFMYRTVDARTRFIIKSKEGKPKEAND